MRKFDLTDFCRPERRTPDLGLLEPGESVIYEYGGTEAELLRWLKEQRRRHGKDFRYRRLPRFRPDFEITLPAKDSVVSAGQLVESANIFIESNMSDHALDALQRVPVEDRGRSDFILANLDALVIAKQHEAAASLARSSASGFFQQESAESERFLIGAAKAVLAEEGCWAAAEFSLKFGTLLGEALTVFFHSDHLTGQKDFERAVGSLIWSHKRHPKVVVMLSSVDCYRLQLWAERHPESPLAIEVLHIFSLLG